MAAVADNSVNLGRTIHELSPGKYDLKLHINVAGVPKYTTHLTLTIVMEGDSKFIELKNPCIEVDTEEYSEIVGDLDPDHACFNPRLKTIPGEYTQTDILQVLKTKLYFLLRPEEETHTIVNVARKIDRPSGNEIGITAYRLLRGLSPVYAKYGYNYGPLLPYIIDLLDSLEWGDIKGYNIDSFNATIDKIYGTPEIDDDTPIYEAFQEFSLEDEMEIQKRRRVKMVKAAKPEDEENIKRLNISRNVLGEILYQHNIPFEDFVAVITKGSEEWYDWSSMITIRKFSIKALGQGGGRRKLTRRRRRQSRRLRLR